MKTVKIYKIYLKKICKKYNKNSITFKKTFVYIYKEKIKIIQNGDNKYGEQEESYRGRIIEGCRR